MPEHFGTILLFLESLSENLSISMLFLSLDIFDEFYVVNKIITYQLYSKTKTDHYFDA